MREARGRGRPFSLAFDDRFDDAGSDLAGGLEDGGAGVRCEVESELVTLATHSIAVASGRLTPGALPAA